MVTSSFAWVQTASALPKSGQAGYVSAIKILALAATVLCLSLRAIAQPANDNFNNATLLDGTEFAITADNSLATVEPGEPVQPPPAAGHTLWWKWTAPGDGWIEFQADSTTTMALAVYAGDGLTNLAPAQQALASWYGVSSWVVRGGSDYYIVASAVTNSSGVVTRSEEHT